MLFSEHITIHESAFMYSGLLTRRELFLRKYPEGVQMIKFHALHYINGFKVFKHKYSHRKV